MQRGLRRLISPAASPAAAAAARRFLSQEVAAEESCMAALPKMPAFDYTPPPYAGPSGKEILKKRREYLSPSMFHFYSHP